MKKTIYILLCSLIVSTMAIAAFLIPSNLMYVILALLLKSEGGELISLAVLAAFTGLILALLSLLPSYKLSLRLAKLMEKKWGIKIEEPKKLFWAAALAPVGLLILVGLIT